MINVMKHDSRHMKYTYLYVVWEYGAIMNKYIMKLKLKKRGLIWLAWINFNLSMDK